MSGRILIGTSSWADPGFVKEWYPPKMAAKERLPWYAQRFQTVELNSSFYAVPDRSTVHQWVAATPDEFLFDVKVHRALSRHAAPLDSLPPDLRDGVATTERGRIRLSGPNNDTKTPIEFSQRTYLVERGTHVNRAVGIKLSLAYDPAQVGFQLANRVAGIDTGLDVDLGRAVLRRGDDPVQVPLKLRKRAGRGDDKINLSFGRHALPSLPECPCVLG